MINFSGIIRSKLFKFSIVAAIIVIFVWGFYKDNKKEIKEVVFMYSENLDEEETPKSSLEQNRYKLLRDSFISKYQQQNKKWYSKKEQEYKEKLDLIKRQKREEIMKKYYVPPIETKQLTENEKAEIIKNVAKRTEENFKHMELLKKEYERKKRSGRINYKRRIRSKDYVYVSVKPITNFKEAQKGVKVEKIDFVIIVDSDASKKFNEKLIGKKINDVVELEIEDFLSEDRIKRLKEGLMYADMNAKHLIRLYPALENTLLKDIRKNVRFKMQTTILDVLDKNFIERNNVKDKTFDYNLWK